MNPSAFVYDIEIVKGIADKKSPTIPGIEYCAGWNDHANMGISVIGVYDYLEDRSRVFLKDNFADFVALVNTRDIAVSFNGIGFDNKVITHGGCDISETKSYDLLAEIWAASGLARTFSYPTHIGFGLDAVCSLNFGTTKSGSGALAPVLWQQGRFGEVIDYCLNDVALTKQLFDAVLRGDSIISPKGGANLLLPSPV